MQMQIIIDRFLRSEKSRTLNLKPLDKLLMFFLASYMGTKDSCFPSYSTLMTDLGINDRTALSNSFKRLEESSILIIKKEKGKSHKFSFNLDFIPVGNPYDTRRDSNIQPVGNPYANNININNINNNSLSKEQRSKIKQWDGPAKTATKASSIVEDFIKKTVN